MLYYDSSRQKNGVVMGRKRCFVAGFAAGAAVMIATIVALAVFAPEDSRYDGRTYMG
jgi:hypothetical protein